MSRRKREYIPLEQRLAASLVCLLPQAQRDELRAAKVPARAVIRLFEMDHVELFALGGGDDWWNIDPKLKGPHKAKSAKDTGRVAKVRRIEPAWREFTRMMASPGKRKVKRSRARHSPRKIKSRGFGQRQPAFGL